MEDVSHFQRSMQSNDLEILDEFFERGTKRNRALRAKYGITEVIIPQDELDDLLVKASSSVDGQELFAGSGS